MTTTSNHAMIDRRSLAFANVIADRIINDPGAIARARATLKRWMTTCSPGVRTTLLEWQAILDGPVDGVIRLLRSTDERATRLRQSNPFTGVLSNRERNAIIKQYPIHESPTA